jgi:hypothetical protein
MHKVRGNYSSCTGKSSENICNSSGGAQEKRKTCSKPDETRFGTKSGAFLSLTPHPLNANVLFCRFFSNITRFWTKLRVLVLTLQNTLLRNELCIQPDPRQWQTLKNQLPMWHFQWELGRDPPYIPWYLCCRDLSVPVWFGIILIHFNTQLVLL